MNRDAVEVVPGTHDITNLKSELSKRLDQLSFVDKGVSHSLRGMLNKVPNTVKIESLGNLSSAAKNEMKTLESPQREYFQYFFLYPLQIEAKRKSPDEIDHARKRQLFTQLREIMKGTYDPSAGIRMMQQGLSKGSPSRSQISPGSRPVFSSISDLLRDISKQISQRA